MKNSHKAAFGKSSQALTKEMCLLGAQHRILTLVSEGLTLQGLCLLGGAEHSKFPFNSVGVDSVQPLAGGTQHIAGSCPGLETDKQVGLYIHSE